MDTLKSPNRKQGEFILWNFFGVCVALGLAVHTPLFMAGGVSCGERFNTAHPGPDFFCTG